MNLYVITIGLFIILVLFGGILLYFLMQVLDSRDASSVDSLPKKNKEEAKRHDPKPQESN